MSHEEEISDTEKVRIVSDFILHAPPGNKALNVVRQTLIYRDFRWIQRSV